MIRFGDDQTFHSRDADDALAGDRTRIVRSPAGADSSLFGGWGVRI